MLAAALTSGAVHTVAELRDAGASGEPGTRYECAFASRTNSRGAAAPNGSGAGAAAGTAWLRRYVRCGMVGIRAARRGAAAARPPWSR